MQMARKWFSAVFCSGTIYAIGGACDDEKVANTVEKHIFDEINGHMLVVCMHRHAHAACAMNGKIFVVGGMVASSKIVNTIKCYNPATDSWRVIGISDDKLMLHFVVAFQD